MATQKSLFDSRPYRGSLPSLVNIVPPTADQTVHATLPAYHAFLSATSASQYTPDDFTADIRRFGHFTGSKRLEDVQTADIQKWIGQLKQTMPSKTVSRKVSAVRNYFRWLAAEHVLTRNPAESVPGLKVAAPLPQLLFASECDRLLATASADPRTYLLVLLVLETGLKKAELLGLRVDDFDFSNQYQPELWVRHGSRQAFKDRRLKLPAQIGPVFRDYVTRYGVTEELLPYTSRYITLLLNSLAHRAGITKKVSVGILRDMFVVRSVKQGMPLDDALAKLGLSKTSYEDARKKYGRLTGEAL